jgi:hypothetical protein
MSSKEATPLQQDMFSGDWKDNRTRSQRKSDRDRSKPQQSSMFAFGDTYEFGASYRPWLKEAPAGSLVLEREDIRTPEEIEQDLIREANAHSDNMFEAAEVSALVEPAEPSIVTSIPTSPGSVLSAQVPDLSAIGFRKYSRQQLAKLRTRS